MISHFEFLAMISLFGLSFLLFIVRLSLETKLYCEWVLKITKIQQEVTFKYYNYLGKVLDYTMHW